MNRILFEQGEIGEDGVVELRDFRADHIVNVLHSEVGDILKTGVVDGPIGTGEVIAAEPGRICLRTSHAEKSLSPWIDLILAPPRPRVLKRLLPQMASMGVGRIALVGAQKVEKDFWGATLLKEEIYRPLLLDGLMQAGTSIMPQIFPCRNLRRFLADELDTLMPSKRRIIAHPYDANGTPGDSVAQVVGGSGGTSSEGRVVLAVGPEGGWTDREVEMFEQRGFVRYSLGGRILRTDTALIALLARLMA